MNARVARLMRWYPAEWRARYGDEFEELLTSTLAEGKGGFRMSFDVAKEGLIARAAGCGMVGSTASPLRRARASVVEIFVGIVTFLAAATLLSHYVERWRAFPTSVALARAQVRLDTLSRAANRGINDGAPLPRAAAERLHQLEVQRIANHAYLQQASGAPVVFHLVTQLALCGAIAGLGAILLVALAKALGRVTRRTVRGLVLPALLLLIACGLFVLGEVASRLTLVPLSFNFEVRAILQGRTWAWPAVANTLCPLVAIIFLCTGGALLLSRAELGVRACRVVGLLAVGAAVCVGVALVGTLAWALTLSSQAPGFLFWDHQGLFGTSLLSVFVACVVVMAGASGLVLTASARCLRVAARPS